MIVRDAIDKDFAAISAILNHAIRTSTAVFTEDETDAVVRTAWASERRAGGFPVIVVEIDGTVAGYASYGPFRSFPGFRQTVEHSLYVAPEMQRKGVGRALLEALIARAEAAGLHVMVGGIDADNAASLALHQALGFRETARMPETGMKFGRWLTLVFMQRQLDTRIAPGETR